MANPRIKFDSNEQSILYAETGGACPLCTSPMMFKKASSNKLNKGYEIAHIYPLNANPVQKRALARFPAPPDLNALENLILLCPSCHTKYDKDFKIEEYLELLAIKKNYLSEAEARQTASQHVLHEEIKEILDIISKDQGGFEDLKITKLDVASLDKKLIGVSPLQRRDIRNNAVDFYVSIRNQIRLIEQRDQAVIRILQNQINTYYLLMSQQNPDSKDFVFNSIAKWISLRTGRDIMAARVLVSFFVQNCEVF